MEVGGIDSRCGRACATGGFLSLLVTGTHFSVSSGLGFLALIGVSVEIGVIMVEYINQLRTRGLPVREAAKEGAQLRLRPIMLTMLVATLGLLPRPCPMTSGRTRSGRLPL